MKAIPAIAMLASVILSIVVVDILVVEISSNRDLTNAIGYTIWIGIDLAIQTIKLIIAK